MIGIARQIVPDLLILGGVGMAIGGIYLLLGLAVTLIVAGVLAAGYGAALDLRTVRRGPR